MKKYFYQNYAVTFTRDYIMSDFITENGLEDAEIILMFQEEMDKDGYYEYQIIFKIPKN